MRHLILLSSVVCLLSSCCHPSASCRKETGHLNISALEGTWSYLTDDKCSYKGDCHHGWAVRGFINNEGRLVFKFVQQYYDSEPVFLNYSVKNDEITINFQMAPYDNGSNTTNQLKFVLREVNGVLQGELYQGSKVQTITLDHYGNYINTKQFEGIWNVLVNDRSESQTDILKGYTDERGRPAFTLLR
jgi:hypothetical protein